MQSRFLPLATILGGLLLSPGASAAVVATFANDITFSSTLDVGFGTESFETLAVGDLGISSLSVISGAYEFSFSTDSSDSLWTSLDAGGSRLLSTTNNNMPLTISLAGGNVTALGSYVFLSDYDGNRIAGNLTFTLGNGEVFNYDTVADDSSYLGLLSNSADPITSLTVTTGTDFAWIVVDKVVVGQAIPEPSTYAAVLGALVLGLALWRRHGHH